MIPGPTYADALSALLVAGPAAIRKPQGLSHYGIRPRYVVESPRGALLLHR